MIKFGAGWSEARQAHVVGLGLSEDSLRLLLQGRPLHVRGEDVGLPESGCDVVLQAAADREGIRHRLDEMMNDVRLPLPGGALTVLRLQGGVYVLACAQADSARVIYLVGLDAQAYRVLRARRGLAFRVRRPGGAGTSVEVLLFWGPTEALLEEQFYAAGLVGPETRVSRTRQER